METNTDFCVRRLKTLADDTRFAVLGALMAQPLTVGALAERLGVEQSLLSHHLRLLRDEQLVEAVRHGRSVEYRLAEGVRLSPTALDLGCCRMVFPET